MSEVQTPSMGFFDAIKSAYSNYANFSGRARRSEYWWFFLFNQIAAFLGGCLIGFMVGASGGDEEAALGLLFIVSFFAFGLPGLSLTVRRLHDLGYSGAILLLFLLLLVIPIINLIAMICFIVMMCNRGELGSNKYGPDPRYAGNASGGTPTPRPVASPPATPPFAPTNPVFPSSPTPPPPPPPPPPAPDTGVPPGLGLTESSDDDCPECGISVPSDEATCPVCGYNLVDCVSLTANGQSITIRSQMEFGNRNLSSLVGEDAQYMSSAQFTILKVDGTGWMIVGSQSAKNATYLNGEVLSAGGKALAEGDVISLKNETAKVTVILGPPEE